MPTEDPKQSLPDDSLELAWMAGFFDGEGYVGIARTSHSYALQLQISQKVRAPLESFLRFGGCIRRNGLYFRWDATSWEAVTFMEAIRPYVRLKGEQMDIGVWFMNRRRGVRTGRTPARLRASRAARHVEDEADYRELRRIKGRPIVSE